MPLDPEQLKIPAYLRKKGITTRARQKLILTALDRKEAGLSPKSKRALAPSKKIKPTFRKKTSSQLIEKKSTSWRFLGPVENNDAKDSTILNKYPEIRSHQSRQTPAFDSPLHFEAENENSSSGFPRFAKIIPIGTIAAYYEKIQVAVIHLEAKLHRGDIIQITSNDFLFQQPVQSMQINRQDVESAKKGSDIGLKVGFVPKINGMVYRVITDEKL